MFAVLVLFAEASLAQDVIKLRSGPTVSGAATECDEAGITLKSSGGEIAHG